MYQSKSDSSSELSLRMLRRDHRSSIIWGYHYLIRTNDVIITLNDERIGLENCRRYQYRSFCGIPENLRKHHQRTKKTQTKEVGLIHWYRSWRCIQHSLLGLNFTRIYLSQKYQRFYPSGKPYYSYVEDIWWHVFWGADVLSEHREIVVAIL